MGGHVTRIRKMRNTHIILVEKPEGKRPLVGLWNRCHDNIKMGLKETGCKTVDGISGSG
jgi:hypothetical protein